MSKVFVSVSMTLDGYAAPVGKGLLEPGPALQVWLEQWMTLQHWVAQQQYFKERLKIGGGGETGPDNDLVKRTFERTGVTIMGKRMFDAGEKSWPEEAPFHTPVFVLTHEKRAPWERPGGTTFHFVNDGPAAALARAREVAGDRDIRIGGGAHTIVEYLNAGLVEEMHVALSPVVFGEGIPLFGGIDRTKVALEIVGARASKHAIHLEYRVSGRR
jgi:dihydrofolate reductase